MNGMRPVEGTTCEQTIGINQNMDEPATYYLRHAHGLVDLVLTGDRFIVNTQGVGLLDKLRTVDIPLSSLRNFCVAPTIGAQNIISRQGGEGGDFLYDRSYDAEFIFSYQADGKLRKKRTFVNRHDDAFQTLLESLVSMRPEASLLHLKPAEAQKQIGVMTARKGVFIIVGLLVGLPIVIAMIAILIQALGGYKD